MRAGWGNHRGCSWPGTWEGFLELGSGGERGFECAVRVAFGGLGTHTRTFQGFTGDAWIILLFPLACTKLFLSSAAVISELSALGWARGPGGVQTCIFLHSK